MAFSCSGKAIQAPAVQRQQGRLGRKPKTLKRQAHKVCEGAVTSDEEYMPVSRVSGAHPIGLRRRPAEVKSKIAEHLDDSAFELPESDQLTVLSSESESTLTDEERNGRSKNVSQKPEQSTPPTGSAMNSIEKGDELPSPVFTAPWTSLNAPDASMAPATIMPKGQPLLISKLKLPAAKAQLRKNIGGNREALNFIKCRGRPKLLVSNNERVSSILKRRHHEMNSDREPGIMIKTDDCSFVSQHNFVIRTILRESSPYNAH